MSWLHVLLLVPIVAGSSPPSICVAPNIFTVPLHCPLEPVHHESFSNSVNDSSSQQEVRWNVSWGCYKAGTNEYCTYTDAHFNSGEGISIITTAESIASISNKQAFQNKVSISKTDGPYREARILGRGRGLVATKVLRAGQNLISQIPAVVVNADAIEKLKKDEMEDLLARAADSLPLAHRDKVLELSTHDGAKNHREKVGKILRTNSFSTGFHDGKSNFQSLFTTISRINHSCRPNCAYFFDSNTFSQKVVAVRDIQPREELSVAYIDPIMLRSERQMLLKGWGFECSCERCSANATQVAESDGNITEIQRLWRELDNYSASSRATPAMAERLILLYHREGLESRIQEAHYRAAVEWIGVGEIEKASEHAMRCVKYGTLFKGPGRPFIKKMEQLLGSPTAHPHWMFRLKHSDVQRPLSPEMLGNFRLPYCGTAAAS
ncbi:hypothetical protein F5Y09DRAFT_295603 [Xylaria sp. FL1042]|nr:hypothetical protein F5Y09DRAFT_295603 [Xylaria sp. FL1042]